MEIAECAITQQPEVNPQDVENKQSGGSVGHKSVWQGASQTRCGWFYVSPWFMQIYHSHIVICQDEREGGGVNSVSGDFSNLV